MACGPDKRPGIGGSSVTNGGMKLADYARGIAGPGQSEAEATGRLQPVSRHRFQSNSAFSPRFSIISTISSRRLSIASIS